MLDIDEDDKISERLNLFFKLLHNYLISEEISKETKVAFHGQYHPNEEGIYVSGNGIMLVNGDLHVSFYYCEDDTFALCKGDKPHDIKYKKISEENLKSMAVEFKYSPKPMDLP